MPQLYLFQFLHNFRYSVMYRKTYSSIIIYSLYNEKNTIFSIPCWYLFWSLCKFKMNITDIYIYDGLGLYTVPNIRRLFERI